MLVSGVLFPLYIGLNQHELLIIKAVTHGRKTVVKESV